MQHARFHRRFESSSVSMAVMLKNTGLKVIFGMGHGPGAGPEEFMNWTEWTELNVGTRPGAPNCTERTIQTNWGQGNWTVLNWFQTSLNFEREDLASQPSQCKSGPEAFVNWAEWTELNRGTWPLYPELNWTNFPGKLVLRELNCTELMPNKFELCTKRPCKFTNSFAPGQGYSYSLWICLSRVAVIDLMQST